MAAQRAAKTNATEESRLVRDESLMKKLRIFHEPETVSDEWPSTFKNTFNNVVALGSFRFHTYDEISNDHSTSTWRQATKFRAKQLSDTARRLLKEKPSELTWRLEIETLVDARFSLRTECKTCSGPGRSGRSWRSEVEVVAEAGGPISDDLIARRRSRVPCKCVELVYPGVNTIFSNRADQVFSYDSHATNDLCEVQNGSRTVPERRPDRVYGLCQTTNFEDRLGATAQNVLNGASQDAASLLQTTAESGNDELLVEDFLQTTPFHQRGEPLLFPFLILEAKSEEGKGHRNCGVQTSLPIWGLLRSQERLAEVSCPLEELGGPFVWYISYLGDSWRVSGCYTIITKGKKNYDIRDLWNGRVSSPDGALQLLLIIDYIFDWARDLYRPSILRCLETMDEDFDSRMSFVADTDINSTRRTCRLDTWREAETSAGSEEIETSASDNSLLDPWKTYDLLAHHTFVDYKSRVFRHAFIIKTSFQCLYLTRDNMMSFINCLGGSPSKYQKIARTALQALRDGPMNVSQRTLSNIEFEWTGTIRESHHTAPESNMVCSIVHVSAISSKTWELSRTLFCLAVDDDVLSRIRQYSKLEKSTFLLEGVEKTAPQLGQETVAYLLSNLKSRNMRDTVQSALSHTVDFWRPLSRLSIKKRKLVGKDYEHIIILEPRTSGGDAIKNLVQEIYKRHKPSGLLVPDAPCLRFSAQIERLERQRTADLRHSLPPEVPIRNPTFPEDGLLLLCSGYRNHKHMCVLVTKDTCAPTVLTEVVSTLIESISGGRYFVVDCITIVDNNKFQYGLQAEGNLIPLIKTGAQLWGIDLLNNFCKEHNKDDYQELYDHDENIKKALWKGQNYHRWQPFSGSREPDFVRRPRPNQHVGETTQHMEHYLAGSVDVATPESDIAEMEAILMKWGPARLRKALVSMMEKFD